MNKIKKKGDTSIRVLETLKLLSKKPASIQEIIHHFEKTDKKNKIYTSEVILKYINTLKVFGFKFDKDKDKYVLLNAYPKFDFDKQDIFNINLLKNSVENFPENSVKNEVQKLLQEIERKFSDDTILLNKNMYTPIIKIPNINHRNKNEIVKLEKYCTDGLKLKIHYIDFNNKDNLITAEPKGISYSNNNVYFSIYNSNTCQIQDIKIEDIKKIEQLPQRVNSITMPSSVTFLLKDRLAKAYKIKETERLLTQNADGSVVIINQGEDRVKLLNRLMRYGEKCEVISPKAFRDEFRLHIKSVIEIYDR